MRSFWTKIGLAALGIFLVGMLAVTLARQTTQALAQAVKSTVDRTATKLSLVGAHESDFPFMLNGERLGRVTHLDIKRAARGGPIDLHLIVRLEDDEAVRALEVCDLVPRERRYFDVEDGFRCAEAGERDLTEVGAVEFEPAGVVRPLMLGREALEDTRSGDAFHASADLEGKDADGVFVRVSDAAGRSLVRLFADSNGAFLRVRDKHGRELVRMRADENGFSLMVDKPDSD